MHTKSSSTHKKAKVAKGEKSQGNAFTAAFKDAGVEGSATCESVKAKDILEALVKPRVDAAAGAAWPVASAKDYTK